MMKVARLPLYGTVLLVLSCPLIASTITEVGIDDLSNDAWRTSEVVKPFGDLDNIYGSDGYFIAQYPEGDARNLSQPSYATIGLIQGAYEGAGA